MPLNNPYKNLPDSELQKTTIVLGAKDLAFVDSLHCRTGTMKHTLGTLFAAFVQSLKQNNFTDYEPDRFEQFTNSLAITGNSFLPNVVVPDTAPDRSTASVPEGTNSQTSPGDVGCGVDRVASKGPRKPSKRSNSKRTL